MQLTETKKWKAGAVYELVDKTGFLEYAAENKQLLPYVSGRFKVLEIDDYGDIESVENIDLDMISKRSSVFVILTSEEREFFKRVKD